MASVAAGASSSEPDCRLTVAPCSDRVLPLNAASAAALDEVVVPSFSGSTVVTEPGASTSAPPRVGLRLPPLPLAWSRASRVMLPGKATLVEASATPACVTSWPIICTLPRRAWTSPVLTTSPLAPSICRPSYKPATCRAPAFPSAPAGL